MENLVLMLAKFGVLNLALFLFFMLATALLIFGFFARVRCPTCNRKVWYWAESKTFVQSADGIVPICRTCDKWKKRLHDSLNGDSI